MNDFLLDWYKMILIFTGAMGFGMLIKAGLSTEAIVMISLSLVFASLAICRWKSLKKEVH
jgi:hypothetical protein